MGQTGPDSRNITGHRDWPKNDKKFFVTAYSCMSYTMLSFQITEVLP